MLTRNGDAICEFTHLYLHLTHSGFMPKFEKDTTQLSHKFEREKSVSATFCASEECRVPIPGLSTSNRIDEYVQRSMDGEHMRYQIKHELANLKFKFVLTGT